MSGEYLRVVDLLRRALLDDTGEMARWPEADLWAKIVDALSNRTKHDLDIV